MSTPRSTPTRQRAVVLGAGVTGLLVASVLAESYAEVTIVERDQLPVAPDQRRGVPQGRHVHGLLPLGATIAQGLLPGLTEELLAAGAHPVDVAANVRWYLQGRQLKQQASGMMAVSASRPLIEATMRARVRTLTNVTILDGHDIVGVKPSAGGDRVVGVRATSVRGEGSRVLPADLVVDASGRGSRAARWLTELGYPAPPTDRVNIDLGYASRVFEIPPRLLGDDVVVVVARYPGRTRNSVLQLLEDGTALVTLGGIVGERPPADLDGFAEYARGLPVPDPFEVIRAGRPVGEAAVFQVPTYSRHRFERLDRLPAGFLVAGDAMCAFNPVYAQGMSVAAHSAAVLREELRDGGEPDPYRFFRAAASVLEAPWGLSVGADLAATGVTGPELPPSPLPGDYLPRLQRAAADDAELAVAYLRVTSLLDPVTTLLRPDLVARVEAHAAAGATR